MEVVVKVLFSKHHHLFQDRHARLSWSARKVKVMS